MSEKFGKWTLAIAFLCITINAHAATVVIQPDAAAGKDAEITSGIVSDIPNGNGFFLIVNHGGNLRSIGLIEFDLSGVPIGATINSATLELFQDANPSAGTQYDAFRVTSAWNEATVTFDTAPTFAPGAVSTMIIGDTGNFIFRQWDVTGVVGDWVTGTFPNFGFWIEEIPIQGSGIAMFGSSDNPGTLGDPKLTVDFTVVPVPSVLPLVALAAMGLGFCRQKAR